MNEGVCIYREDQLIARHSRSYDRHQDIEDPDHPKALLAQRRNAREQRLLMHFLALSPKAQAYFEGLESRRLNARHHLRKIVALAQIYGAEATARALEDGLVLRFINSATYSAKEHGLASSGLMDTSPYL